MSRAHPAMGTEAPKLLGRLLPCRGQIQSLLRLDVVVSSSLPRSIWTMHLAGEMAGVATHEREQAFKDAHRASSVSDVYPSLARPADIELSLQNRSRGSTHRLCTCARTPYSQQSWLSD
jgi:hypothetical protein